MNKVRGAAWVTISAVGAVLLIAVFFWYRSITDPVSRGIRINRQAWELSFTERGFPIPVSGPREGYWGSRLGSKIQHPNLGWHEPAVTVSGLLEIDDRGFQHYRSADPNKANVLILGGSVAFGAYASAISKTYFHLIGVELEHRSISANLTIIAAGAWKSIQELKALELYGPTLKPDLVIFLNGLNDLTNGATSRTLYGEPIETLDGSKWTPLYHIHDYHQRVEDYLQNMRSAAEFTRALRSELLVVLQPSLVERRRRTRVEDVLLEGSLTSHASAEVLRESYETMRRALGERARSAGIHFLDCSRVFNDEAATTFSDIWHFSDFGQEILAKAMTRHLVKILQQNSMPRIESSKKQITSAKRLESSS